MADMLAKRFLLASEEWRDVMKVPVIASEPITADRLRAALGRATDDADEGVDADALQQRFGLPVQRAE